MKKDFLSFAENKQTSESQSKESQKTTQTNFQDREIKEEINKYAHKSEAELMQELFSIANKNKKDGSLKNTDLDSFQEQITPYLTAEQKARLDMLITQLKG